MPKEARKEKKKRKRDRENLKDQDRPHAADVPEDSQVETASDHERRKGSEKPGATSAAPMTTVAPSPFAPKGLSSVGVTFHKGSCKFQVGRKWGKTMFYGKPKVLASDDVTAAIIHDRWLLKGGPLIPKLTPQEARDLGLNYDLKVHEDPEVIQLLRGTTGATAFSTYALVSARMKAIKALSDRGQPTHAPVDPSYVEGSRLTPAALPGMRPGSAPMPAWRRPRGVRSVHVLENRRSIDPPITRYYAQVHPGRDRMTLPGMCTTLEEAAVRADLFLLCGGRLDPPLTRQGAREIGLNYDLGVHSDRAVAELLEGTDPTTAFSRHHTRLITRALNRARRMGTDHEEEDAQKTPEDAAGAGAGAGAGVLGEMEGPARKRLRRFGPPSSILQNPPLSAAEGELTRPGRARAFLRELGAWLGAQPGETAAARARMEEMVESAAALGDAARTALCERLNAFLLLFVGDGLSSEPLVQGKEVVEWCREELEGVGG